MLAIAGEEGGRQLQAGTGGMIAQGNVAGEDVSGKEDLSPLQATTLAGMGLGHAHPGDSPDAAGTAGCAVHSGHPLDMCTCTWRSLISPGPFAILVQLHDQKSDRIRYEDCCE